MSKAISVKKVFSKEAQSYIQELKNKVLELNVGHSNFHEQLEDLISTNHRLHSLLADSEFGTSKEFLVELNSRFESSINLLRGLQQEVDWITKELFLEVINITSQIINEYCLDRKIIEDKISLQNNLFNQISEHLSKEQDEYTSFFKINQSLDNPNNLNSANSITDAEIDAINDPFQLEDSAEALHLFDFDTEIDSHDLDSEINHDDSENFLMIQLDEDESLESLDLFSNDSEELSPDFFPELSSDIFDSTAGDIALPPALSNPFPNESIKENGARLNGTHLPNQEVRLPIPKLLADIFLESSSEPLLGEQEDTEIVEMVDEDHEVVTIDDDHLESDWDGFINLDFSTADVDTALEESPIYQSKSDDCETALEESPIYQSQSANLPDHQIEEQGISYEEFVNSSSEQEAEHRYELQGETTSQESHNHDASNTVGAEEKNLSNPLSLRQGQQIVSKNDATIRIPVSHLEVLGDLSEELLVRKGSLDVYLGQMRVLSGEAQRHLQLLESDVSDQNQTAIAGLQKSVERIVNVLDLTEQQTYAMSQDVRHLRQNLRQVLKHPISSLVRKFPRILRDLSIQHGKQVELVVQGADISVERLISEIIAEPLEVLLRNAFEHGIESAYERQRQGKPVQGKIEFIVTQTDDSTIIKISDDGNGVDIDKIRNHVEQSAAVAGMPGFSAMDMADEQLVGLIFEPSFHQAHSSSSADTKPKLSDIRKKLREFGGTISVSSQPRQGTQFTMVLPHLLSLMRILLLDINQMCLAMPSQCVLAVIPIDSHNESYLEQDALLWRDRFLPIVRLDEVLKLNCRRHHQDALQISQTNPSSNSLERSRPPHAVPTFVIVQHENDLFAMQTDGCWNEQEATFHQVEGDILLPQIFLGTVVLGTNQAMALLNPAEIVSQCLRSRPNDAVLISHNSDLDSLSSLSDFFSASDVETDNGEKDSEFLPEPENLESSQLFISSQIQGQIFNSSPRSQPPRVLIVESSANIRRYLAMTLNKLGFETYQAGGRTDAIAILRQCLEKETGIEAVITDLEMPNREGFNLLSDIRDDRQLQGLPVVVLNAQDNQDDWQQAQELGADAYFSKPYQAQELVDKLQQLLGS
ncbi:ATP-binding response regulator [Pseudanabaena mucicola]|uniref:histidine kinase n=1 Tax=Pseudanabaena mucicola FACHB-723 TaxID=2692860 RepID=A0ABR7ZVL3_9CYAN|nr:response regulator [Pseudanabaena mucicola]MBD2187847.1 response regulator [Pseudanabaena mucicola FACHB-723]